MSRTAWILGLTAGAVVVGGGIAIAAMPTKKTAAVPPGPPNFTAIITDPNMVRQYQTMFAADVAAAKAPLNQIAYTAAQVNGDPTDQQWMAALAKLQVYANANPWQSAPAGFPAILRTDGVLDYATALIIANA
jgi:hypothetical protein